MTIEFVPVNEQGVIVLFSAQAGAAGWEFVSIGASYPDAVLCKDGEEWHVEFEFKASNFLDHKHDHRECDLIICWENDYPDNPLPTIALSDPAWVATAPVRASAADVTIEYWKRRALRAEGQYKLARNTIMSPTLKFAAQQQESKESRAASEERVKKLAQLVETDKQWPTAKAVSEMFSVSLRTAYNDLDAVRKLREAVAPQ